MDNIFRSAFEYWSAPIPSVNMVAGDKLEIARRQLSFTVTFLLFYKYVYHRTATNCEASFFRTISHQQKIHPYFWDTVFVTAMIYFASHFPVLSCRSCCRYYDSSNSDIMGVQQTCAGGCRGGATPPPPPCSRGRGRGCSQSADNNNEPFHHC